MMLCLFLCASIPLLLLLLATVFSPIIGGFAHAEARPAKQCKPTLLIQITTRDCPPVVLRALTSIRFARKHVCLERLEIWIVTERRHFAMGRHGGARVLLVPRAFDCGAQHKARALEYARQVRMQENYTGWVYFIDEENWVSAQTLIALLHCIERRNCDMATGPIRYERSGAAVPWLADSLRTAQFRICHICHSFSNWVAYGENLLVNSELERSVPWVCDSLTEDAVFTGRAASMGFRTTWHGGVLNSSSAMSVTDLILQRRRWFGGLVSACRESTMAPRYRIALLVILVSALTAPLFVCAFLIAGPFAAGNNLSGWRWGAPCVLMLAWIYGTGCTGRARERVSAALLGCGLMLLECAAAWWAIARPPSNFYIVAKEGRFRAASGNYRRRSHLEHSTERDRRSVQ